jgi:hypothetical protein
MSETISRDEFIERFVKRMIEVAGATFADGSSIEEYARDTAGTYFDDPSYREEGPEACAESDMEYWED